MSLLEDEIKTGNVLPTGRKEKHSIDNVPHAFEIYRIRCDHLFYNDQNDRIATWVSEYNSAQDADLLTLGRDEYNDVIEEFIVNSNPGALRKTEKSIALRGQLRPGIVLNDGRVIDGNRRLTCIRRLARAKHEVGWFETAILDDATGSDPKRIKLLELAIQIGEEEKVAYDPVDRLVGIYRDVVKNHLITPAEYGNATGMTEAEVKKLIERAQYMEEFLEFCQAPEQYHLARALKVDGPLGEFGQVLNKYKNKPDKQLVKQLMFANIVVQPEGDITRYIRIFNKVAGTDAEADFKASELQAMSELLEKMGPNTLTREKVSELRSDRELVDSFKRASDRAREIVHRIKLMDTPAKESADCLSKLEKILPEMLDVLKPDELKKVRRNLVALANKVEELIDEIDERA
ncbi:hypothetical protein [Arcanobacterium urinimassiliense]|uniref:hypothetical protein n=1 Tax=Arcanobacterium urinimassiliense TaxID=1871014 RepID=UPI00093D3AF2|nr:hypothetical protein [Arcanobacterium urinimassiliense]